MTFLQIRINFFAIILWGFLVWAECEIDLPASVILICLHVCVKFSSIIPKRNPILRVFLTNLTLRHNINICWLFRKSGYLSSIQRDLQPHRQAAALGSQLFSCFHAKAEISVIFYFKVCWYDKEMSWQVIICLAVPGKYVLEYRILHCVHVYYLVEVKQLVGPSFVACLFLSTRVD